MRGRISNPSRLRYDSKSCKINTINTHPSTDTNVVRRTELLGLCRCLRHYHDTPAPSRKVKLFRSTATIHDKNLCTPPHPDIPWT